MESTANNRRQSPFRLETDFQLYLFGAGHVGRALVNTLRDLPIRISWVDSRDNQFPTDNPDNVDCVCSDIPLAEVDAAPAGAYFLVMTHDHALDQSLAEQILKRDDFTYFGLIGSASKRRMFKNLLAKTLVECVIVGRRIPTFLMSAENLIFSCTCSVQGTSVAHWSIPCAICQFG